MTTKEVSALRKIYDQELINYAENLFAEFVGYHDEECYVELSEDILAVLDEVFPEEEYKENYSSSIGQTIYMALYHESIFPLEIFKKHMANDEKEKENFEFYTLFDIEETLKSVSNQEGFLGIMDYYTHVSYNNFRYLFVYSMLKLQNNKI